MATIDEIKPVASGKESILPQNPLWVLVFNIIIPVIILNQGAKRLGPSGPVIALFVALAFPIAFGLYDFITRKKANWISLVGLINVGVTGSFALLKLSGHWFWMKEAAFPLIIGGAIFIGNRMGRPFLWSLFWNDRIFQTEKIETLVKTKQDLVQLFAKATDLFSLSFFISAFANFYIATTVFIAIDPILANNERERILNSQIAQMTWKAYLIVALPMMLFSFVVLWFLVRGLRQLTGLNTDDLLVAEPKKASVV